MSTVLKRLNARTGPRLAWNEIRVYDRRFIEHMSGRYVEVTQAELDRRRDEKKQRRDALEARLEQQVSRKHKMGRTKSTLQMK